MTGGLRAMSVTPTSNETAIGELHLGHLGRARRRPGVLGWLVWGWDRSIGLLLTAIVMSVIWVYRQTVSKWIGPTCRYYPSCSTYAIAAVDTHGALKGVALAAARVGRCNPFTKGGLDPVPQRGYWRPAILPDGTQRPHAAMR